MLTFLSTDQVVQEQSRQLQLYGLGSPGIISRERLDSAVLAAQAGFGDSYFYDSAAAIASAYLVRLAKAHAFGNANKRTSLAAALIYLTINNYVLKASDDELIDLVLASATGNGDTKPAQDFFESRIEVLPGSNLEPTFEDASTLVHERFGPVFTRLADL